MRWTRSLLTRPLLALACLVVVCSCRSASDQSTKTTSEPGELVGGPPPFQTREPNRYQAVRTIIFASPNAQTTETKALISKAGPYRREESTTSSGKKLVYLDCAAGIFLLLPDAKLLAEVDKEVAKVAAESDLSELEESPQKLLHEDVPQSLYQSLGDDAINGRATIKYRVVVNNSSSQTVRSNETLVWVDKELGMPVRTEATSANGSRYSMELSEIKLEVDQQLFQVPKDYKQVGTDVIRRLIGGEN